jgi:hypothetical protein
MISSGSSFFAFSGVENLLERKRAGPAHLGASPEG